MITPKEAREIGFRNMKILKKKADMIKLVWGMVERGLEILGDDFES